MTLLWHYYDTIIVSIITRLWHYYSHYFSYYFTYDRVSSTSVSQCADQNPQPEHRVMTFKGPWRLELDLDHHGGELKQWKVSWRSELVLIYTLCLLLYRLFQMSAQVCCSSKGVLRTPTHCRCACDDSVCNLRGVETPHKLAVTAGRPKLCCVVAIIAIIALL